MSKTVYVVGGDSLVETMFVMAGWEIVHIGPGEGDGGCDLICFTGGEDVSPYLYGEENISSWTNPKRDEIEQAIYEEFPGCPKVGICRGGQFLNVMNGGKMIQHIEGHKMGYHPLLDSDGPEGRYIKAVHGDHHQAMVLAENGVGLYGWGKAVEVAMYYGTKSLCFQPHPEWGHKETRELFFELLAEYLGVSTQSV